MTDQLMSSNFARRIIETVDALIVIMDPDGNIVLFNKTCEEITGYKQNEVLNKPIWDLFILPDEAAGVKSVFTRLASGDYPSSHTNHWRTKNSSNRLIEWSNTVITDYEGNLNFIIGTGIDVTEQKLAEQEIISYQKKLEKIVQQRTAELRDANKRLQAIVLYDELTKIYNRRHLNSVLHQEIHRSVRDNIPLSLMICDIDYFKQYNDTYGHIAGDECLKQIATILDYEFRRAADTVARFGGEEFTIVLPGIHLEQATLLAENLLTTVWDKNIRHSASPIADRLTISAGVTTFISETVFTPEAIIHAADNALYNAKKNGRNRVEVAATKLPEPSRTA